MRLHWLPAILLALAAGLGASAPAQAQSCGGCAGPAVTGSAGADSSWPAEGSFRLRLSEEYEVKDRSYRGRDRVVNDFAEDLYINRAAATLTFGLADGWAGELTLTHVHFSYNLKPPGGERVKLAFDGLGDTSLLFGRRWHLGDDPPDPGPFGDPLAAFSTTAKDDIPPEPRRVSLSLWGGASLPTGDPERPDPRLVTRDVSVSNLQTGTGTVDPQFRARLEIPGEDLDWFGELGARIPLTENRYDYETGAVYAAAVGVSRPLTPELSAALTLTLQEVERDRFRGDDVGVGGGRWLYGTPAVGWEFSDGVTLDLAVRFTLWRDVETKLSDSRFSVQVGLTFAF